MSLDMLLSDRRLTLVRELYNNAATGRAVYHVKNSDLHSNYVLKRLNRGQNDLRAALLEVRALNRLPFGMAQHCHMMFEDSDYFYLLLDWVDGESFAQRFANPPVDRDDLIRRLEAFRLAAIKVEQFHVARISHRDIKPENILIHEVGNRNMTVQIIDFGLAVQNRQSAEGTFGYQAPEQDTRRDFNYTSGIDIFALGQVGWFLLTGYARTLYENADYSDWDAENSPRPDIPNYTPSKLPRELDRATRFHPGRRHKRASNLAAGIDQALRQMRNSRRRRRR